MVKEVTISDLILELWGLSCGVQLKITSQGKNEKECHRDAFKNAKFIT